MTLTQLNHRLHHLGWDDFDLDYHTMQLAIACIEEDFTTLEDDDAYYPEKRILIAWNFNSY